MPLAASQDPTAPLGWTSPKATVVKKSSKKYTLPQLQSIVCRDTSPCYAVLNDQIAKQGQFVSGYKVEKVTWNEVTVARGNKQWQLALFALDIKK